MVMAVRAAKVASREKKHRTKFSSPVEKGGF
jgi:hypothetical protein